MEFSFESFDADASSQTHSFNDITNLPLNNTQLPSTTPLHIESTNLIQYGELFHTFSHN